MSERSILAVDPGNQYSAYVRLVDGVPVCFDKVPNDTMLKMLRTAHAHVLAIETMKPRGMPTSFEEMETQFFAGQCAEAFQGDVEQVFRQDVKLHHCGSVRAKDANLRAALIDRFGGKTKAIGKKKSPGPLYGIANDCWSALAIGLYWHDKHNGA